MTSPAGATVALLLHKDLIIGIDAKDTILLALTFVVSLLTLGTGRTHILAGLVSSRSSCGLRVLDFRAIKGALGERTRQNVPQPRHVKRVGITRQV